jgi:HAD superfamily hydrolase (TIGR01484 family)
VSEPAPLTGHTEDVACFVVEALPGVLALDFDGTLTEIVNDPDEAVLTVERRHVLRRVARVPGLRTVVLSGRRRRDVESRLDVPGVAVVGNHGFEIEGWEMPLADRYRSALTGFLADLEALRDARFRIEDKGQTATLHLQETRADAARDRLREELASRLELFQSSRSERRPPAEREPGGTRDLVRLRLHPGKATLEIRPDVGWNKSSALLHLLNVWGIGRARCFYAGDDLTDECVFAELSNGVTVKVGEGESAARFRARDPTEIYALLLEIVGRSQGRRR